MGLNQDTRNTPQFLAFGKRSLVFCIIHHYDKEQNWQKCFSHSRVTEKIITKVFNSK